MTRLLSNLIKANYIDFSSTVKRVIDSNNREDIFKFNTTTNESIETCNEVTKTFVEGINAVNIDILPEVNTDEMVNDILAKANEKAELIISEATREAQLEKEKVFETAKNEGYSAGMKEGQVEIAKIKDEVELKGITLEKDYEKMLRDVEPSFVKIMIDYLQKLTGVYAEDQKDIIQYLIHQAIIGSENSRNYTLKVSKDDYSFVVSKKEELMKILKNDASLEIVEEKGLNQNECLIETDNRIIDCSLNVKLENLITDLKILAHV